METALKAKPLSQIRNRYPFLFFVFFYLFWVLITYHDYGMTADESGVYARGMGLAHYLIHDDFPGFLHKSVPDDGLVIYDHFYAALLSLFNPSGGLDYYHWLNMFFALFLFGAVFEALLWQTQKPWLALLGPLFLFLTPRFMGDVPANPKDMPFSVFYFLALTGLFFFSRHPKTNPLIKVLVLGLLFGFAQCSRTLGVTLYGVYLLFDLHLYYHGGKHSARDWRRHLLELAGSLFLIFVVANFIWILTWPYLGANYFHHLWEALNVSKNFFWNNNVLFLGKEIPSSNLPWTYLPVWFLVTTPLFLLFFLGASLLFIKNKLKNDLLVLMTVALAFNFFLYLLFKPVLYDGLRHFLFFLPIMATIAALSAAEFLQRFNVPKVKKAILALCLLDALIVVTHLVRLHPYEYIYFNGLIGGVKGAEGRMDNDYWGASYKEGMDWLNKNKVARTGPIKITGAGNPYQIFYYFTPDEKWTDGIKDADYFLSTTRDDKHLAASPFKVIHVVEREGVPLNYIFKLK